MQNLHLSLPNRMQTFFTSAKTLNWGFSEWLTGLIVLWGSRDFKMMDSTVISSMNNMPDLMEISGFTQPPTVRLLILSPVPITLSAFVTFWSLSLLILIQKCHWGLSFQWVFTAAEYMCSLTCRCDRVYVDYELILSCTRQLWAMTTGTTTWWKWRKNTWWVFVLHGSQKFLHQHVSPNEFHMSITSYYLSQSVSYHPV